MTGFALHLYHVGKPKPRVEWYSADGKIVSSLSTGLMDLTGEEPFSGNSDDEETTTKKIVINQLNRSHANITYTCVAENDDNTIEPNLRMTVVINMYREYIRLSPCFSKNYVGITVKRLTSCARNQRQYPL